MGALMAGAKYKGEYEERIKAVLNEVEHAAEDGGPGVILFIDELHLIMAGRGAEGGGMDAANLFKPLLARGKLRCIGATTLAEYRKYIETDAALECRFAQMLVNEPSVGETEAFDKLQRRKLEREKDEASKEHLQLARKAIAQVDEQPSGGKILSSDTTSKLLQTCSTMLFPTSKSVSSI